MDRPDSTGVEQFTSGTLEACHPPKPMAMLLERRTGYTALMMIKHIVFEYG